MGRRVNYGVQLQQNAGRGERSSIGDLEVSVACDKIATLAQTHANMALPWSPEFEPLLTMLFPESTLNKARAVKNIVTPRSNILSYAIAHDVALGLDYSDATLPAIDKACLQLQYNATRLLNTIEEIRAVYLRYEKVKFVLRWLNRNATPGAIRHYWPAALNLCKGSAPLQGVAGGTSRFAEPDGIGEMLQLLRDTSSTMAAALLMPPGLTPRVPRMVGRVRLTFASSSVSADHVTDTVTFNL